MTPELTNRIHQSLPEVLALRDRAPALFQEQFVALDPAPRPVFAGADLRRQGALLIHAVAEVGTATMMPNEPSGAVQNIREGCVIAAP